MANEEKNFDSLGEHTNLINKSLKYTNGDIEKAKLMASGKNKDVSVIKGRFAIDEKAIYGIFIIFVNSINRYIANVNTLIVSNKNVFDRARIFDSWKSYYSDLGKNIQKEGETSIGSYDFTNHLAESITGYDIFSKVDNDELNIITEDMMEIIRKFFNVEKLQCQIELEKASSLDMDLAGIPIEAPGGEDLGDIGFDTDDDKKMSKIEKDADYIINGVVIVSPVKGKYINNIKKGETIKVIFSTNNDISITIAKKLNAYSDDNKFLPVRARIKEKIKLEDGGFIIYGVIAKNILVKIIEEENVKIEMDTEGGVEQTEKGEDQLIIYIALLFGLIILSLIVIFNIL